MDKLLEKNLNRWCQDNGWTNLFTQEGQFYAFPPGAVIPLPLPTIKLTSAKNIRALFSRIMKIILLVNMPVSMMFLFMNWRNNIPFFILLIEMFILNIFLMIIRKLWIWFSFIQLWFRSR